MLQYVKRFPPQAELLSLPARKDGEESLQGDALMAGGTRIGDKFKIETGPDGKVRVVKDYLA